MPPVKRTRRCNLYGGSPSDLPITDLATYGDVARFFYKLKDLDGIKDKNIIVQRTLCSLKEIWFNCNSKLVLLPEKSLIVKLLRFYNNVISWNGNKIKPLTKKLLEKNKEKLFDLLACNCKLEGLPCDDRNIKCSGCSNVHLYCSCVGSKKSKTSISSLNQTRSKNYNTTHYPKFALEVIRYGISDKAAAAVANALLQDIGYLHLNYVIDPSKMKREKERVCFNASFEQSKVSNIKAIGLDSKRNKNSLVYEQRDIDGEINLCKSTSTVNHLTFTIESGELQEKGKGKDLAEFTCNVLKEFKSDKSIQAIILDNTSVNTGKDNGLVACLERILKRRIHLIGCLLHVNELPLRHLISKLDGSSNSSNNYSGPVGKSLTTPIHLNLTVDFIQVETDIEYPPLCVIKDLSADQRMLLEYSIGISRGFSDNKYLRKKIGPICHARWLTTAVRILALYTRTINPSRELKIFVEYIQTVYTPVWFNIKKSKNFTEVPKLIFQFIQRILRLDTEVQGITLPIIYKNSFCLQPENFIAALLYSEEQVYRTIAVVKILETRKTLIKDPKNGLKDGIRVNAIPIIDCKCKNWSKLINLYDIDCFEPPCVEDISNEELLNMIPNQGKAPNFPCHSQTVERAVKMTSDASGKFINLKKRNAYILAKCQSQKKRKYFRTKKDYTL
nr:uncharacterized protein LOC105846338 isoform X2 [Hydra vulgaris]